MSEHQRIPPGIRARWSPIYRPDWDDTPERYTEAGLVDWGRSRRLARFDDPALAFKAYAGVQHDDPARLNALGEPRTRFFLSLFVNNRTVSLRTYSTLDDALAALSAFHTALVERRPNG